MQKNTFGKKGEIVATNFLKKKKYKILYNNYKNEIGEIDIIAKDGDVLVFVEVKTRFSNTFGLPSEAVNAQKQNKIRQVATLYLKQNKLLDAPCRIDVISILGDDCKEIVHIINAF